MITYQGDWKALGYVCEILFSQIFKVVSITNKQKNCLNSCFLLLMFLLSGVFCSFFKVSSRFKEFSLGCLVVGSSLIRKKEKLAAMTTRCHSLSLIVTCCGTCFHSLYHSLPFVVTHCHSLSLVFTRCITRLSFYKRLLLQRVYYRKEILL